MIENQLKTILLLGILTAILLFAGSLIGGQTGLTVALFFSLLMNIGSYWFSDKIVLAMYKAKQVSKAQAPQLHAIVEEVAQKAGIPKPKVYIIPSETANAMATGRNPQHAAVACTEGILKLLNKGELKGVLAHELAHVKNRDTLISTIAAVIAGVISYLGFMARFAMIGGSNDRENRGNIFAFIFLAILAPVAAMIIQLAISRAREFIADERGAQFIHESVPLASALDKLQKVKIPMHFGTQATSHLFIVNPFSGRAFMNLFSTHPDPQERIRRLKAMKF